MIRALLVGALLAGCTESTELLAQLDGTIAADAQHTDARRVPPTDAPPAAAEDAQASPSSDAATGTTSETEGPELDFCPTRIDVYGGVNMLLVGCGGGGAVHEPVEDGYFSPGSSDYDQTVAGRLLVRLAYDPDLAPRYGRGWVVRSCAVPDGTLPQLASPLPEPECGGNSPGEQGGRQSVCMNDPAPILLFSAGMLDDICHGGGPGSTADNDPATYAAHYAERMESFVAGRHARLAIVGPPTEWTSDPAALDDTELGCEWQRPAWDKLGLERWLKDQALPRADGLNVVVATDLHDDFRAHNKCCQILGVPCSTNWSTREVPELANCDGAQAILDFWYAQIKDVLLARNFRCP